VDIHHKPQGEGRKFGNHVAARNSHGNFGVLTANFLRDFAARYSTQYAAALEYAEDAAVLVAAACFGSAAVVLSLLSILILLLLSMLLLFALVLLLLSLLLLWLGLIFSLLLLLSICRSRDSKNQRQNCRSDDSDRLHVCYRV
jgi:hypothetical protein